MRNSAATLTLVLIGLASCNGFDVIRLKRQLYREDIPHYRPLDGKYAQSPNNQNFLHDGGINFDFDGNVKTHNLNANNPMVKFAPEDAIIAPVPGHLRSHPPHPHHPISDNQIHERAIAFVQQQLLVANHQPAALVANAYATPVAVVVTPSQAAPVITKTERFTVVNHNRK